MGVVALRLVTLAISMRNERALKRNGAVEFGAGNSKLIAVVHVIFYISAAAEGLWRDDPADWVSGAGLAIYGFAILVLFAVIRLLGRWWTVKVILARDHQLVRHPLFRYVRHPNYYLNIIPELVGLALALHAFGTLLIGLPIYLIVLRARIRIEEKVMRENFSDY